jgi:hypothetical protein
MQKNKFPYFSTLITIIIINMFFSTYFITIFLMGVVFTIFIDVLKKEYIYLFIFVILTFCFIETIHDIKPFTLTLISFFLYYFIIPKLKHFFSSLAMAKIVYVFFFYLIFYIFSFFTNYYTSEMSIVFIINFLIDCIFVGLLL